jgi:hypothetical protein
VPNQQRFLNWPLVLGAALATLLLLGGLAVTAWAVIGQTEPPLGKTPPRAARRSPVKLPTPVTEDPADLSPSTEEPEMPAKAPPTLPPPEPKATAKKPSPFPAVGEGDPKAACATYGTSVEFLGDPSQASAKALRDKKLLFVLHISGNFEDSKFT